MMDIFDELLINKMAVEDELTKFVLEKTSVEYHSVVVGPWINFLSSENTRNLDGGFKGHLATQTENWKITFSIAMDIFTKYHCQFKVAKSLAILEQLNSLHAPVTEANKFITFYPSSTSVFKKMILELYKRLQGLKSPSITTEWQCGIGNPVHFRYGAFKKHVDWNRKTSRPDFFFFDESGRKLSDQRSRVKFLPQGIKLPFSIEEQRELHLINEPIDDNNQINQYEFKMIIQEINKGSVYSAVRKSDGMRVIIKSANPYVRSNGKNKYAKEQLTNETKFLKELADTNVVPKLLDTFSVQGRLFIVEEFIEGKSINRKLDTLSKDAVIYALINTCKKIHDKGVQIGDLSNNNFIYSKNKCVLIDAEDCSYVNMPTEYCNRTPFYHTRAISPQNQLKSDEFALAICCMMVCFGNPPHFLDQKNPIAISNILLEQLNLAFENKIVSLNVKTIINNLIADSLCVANINGRKALLNDTEILHNLCDDIGLNFSGPVNNGRYWKSNLFAESVSPLSIQHGASGVAAAYIFNETLSNEKIVSFVEKLDFNLSKYVGCDASFLFGSSGYLWFLTDVYQKTNSTKILKLIKNIINNIPEVSEVSANDFALGKAGILYSLVHTAIACDSIDINHIIECYMNELTKEAKLEIIQLKSLSFPSLSMVGFAHGAGGVATAIAIAGTLLHSKGTIEVAKQLNGIIVKKINIYMAENECLRYKDLSWCNGLSGIEEGLLISSTVKGATVPNSIFSTMNTIMLKGYYSVNNSVCHGKESILNTLLDYIELTDGNNGKLVDVVLKLAKNEVLSFTDQQNKTVFFDQSGFGHLLDYGVGQAGTAATLLRVLNHTPQLFQFSSDELYTLQQVRNR